MSIPKVFSLPLSTSSLNLDSFNFFWKLRLRYTIHACNNTHVCTRVHYTRVFRVRSVLMHLVKKDSHKFNKVCKVPFLGINWRYDYLKFWGYVRLLRTILNLLVVSREESEAYLVRNVKCLTYLDKDGFPIELRVLCMPYLPNEFHWRLVFFCFCLEIVDFFFRHYVFDGQSSPRSSLLALHSSCLWAQPF